MKPRHWTIDFRQSAIVSLLLSLFISTVQGAWTSFAPPEMTLHSGDFNDLAIQGKTVLWGATAGGGVVKYDSTGWRTYTELFAEILHDDVNVICVCRDLSGSVWFGTEAGVSVYRNDSTWDHYTTSDGLTNNRVLSIAIDGTGRKWIGTDGGGVSLFDESTWTSFGVTDGMADSIIHAIAVDQSNAIWFGTNSGVSRYEGGVWTSYTTSNGLADNRINAIFIDQDSTKWFATSNGISVFNSTKTTWRTINSPDNFGENIFYTIQKDKLGFYWFGSHRGGVKKYDGTSFLTTYVLEDGLISNTVKTIAIDSNNVRWFGTDNGLSRFINEPPLINPVTSPLAATQDQSFQYTLTATDTDRDAIVFALAETPAGMTTSSSSGTINWTPLNSHVGSNTVKVTISDLNGGFDSLTFTILVQNVNDAPLISSTPPATASQDTAYTYQVIATDPDGDVLTYHLRQAPSAMTIELLTGAIGWTPGNADTGEATIEIGVSDPSGAIALQRYTLRVGNVNDPPFLTSVSDTADTIRLNLFATLTLAVTGADIDGDAISYRWSWNGTKNISNRTGTWSQVLKTAGMHSLKVVLTDGYVRGDSVQWTIVVRAPVALSQALPVKYALLPAYPNPCRSAARIEYAVPAHKSEGAQVSLRIFDLNGQLIKVLEKGVRQPGTYSVVWGRQDRNGKMLPAGNYLYRFFSDGFIQDRIITLQ